MPSHMPLDSLEPPYSRHLMPYLEALPTLVASEAHDALIEGRGRHVWTWMFDGERYAHCDVTSLPGNQLELTMTAVGASIMPQKGLVVGAKQATNYQDRRAFSLFVCPSCNQSTRSLVAHMGWTCKTCSGLPYRSTRLSTKVRLWERRDELDRIVSSGRPKGMHHATFAGLAKELASLKRELGRIKSTPPREYTYRLVGHWVSLARDNF